MEINNAMSLNLSLFKPHRHIHYVCEIELAVCAISYQNSPLLPPLH